MKIGSANSSRGRDRQVISEDEEATVVIFVVDDDDDDDLYFQAFPFSQENIVQYSIPWND